MLYSVNEKKPSSFDPAKPEFQGKFSSQCIVSASSPLNATETLQVDGNSSYFFAADSSRPDFYTNNLGIREAETIKYAYFYEMDKAAETDADSVVTQLSPLSPIVQLRPPDHHGAYSMKLWIVVHDESSDAIRANGFTVRDFSVIIRR